MSYYKHKPRWAYAPNKNNFGKFASEVKDLQLEWKILKTEISQKHSDYMSNVQSPYLSIERKIVKDHKHEYPEYMDLMNKRDEYKKNWHSLHSRIREIELTITSYNSIKYGNYDDNRETIQKRAKELAEKETESIEQDKRDLEQFKDEGIVEAYEKIGADKKNE
ncbi:hypothetical protein LCGC14_0618880 [marine sediment metagenome]|uniref:Uncharacterized protein n=1 Tax=marine sediment metagenome TaxID=412755 RepID=A0A0F9UDW8_9ZZZZ